MRLRFLAALIVCGIPASASIPLNVFNYTGTCTDCTFSNGTLELFAPYTLGTPITTSNFVNFFYTSNLVTFGINQGDPGFFVSGSLPSLLPGPATILIEDNQWEFSSSSDGSWFVNDFLLGQDNGPSNTWSSASASTPEPGTILMLAVGLAALTARYKRARGC
jgi:PEP-CTERM motif-containing protein